MRTKHTSRAVGNNYKTIQLHRTRPYKNIDDLESEMKKVNDGFQTINNNMIAIGMDYKFFLNSNFKDDKVFEFRNNILYRLRATRLHIDIVVNMLKSLDSELSEIFKKDNGQLRMQMHFDRRKSDISALFDSIIFHTISAFDYVSNLVAFLSLKNYKKLKWNELSQSVRDPKNELYNSTFRVIIDQLDRNFVGRLYKHRSDLIHTGKDGEKSSLSIELIKGQVETKIIASNKFNKNFSELRKLSKENDLSISFILFWLLEKTIKSIIDIQFGLKEHIEQNKNNQPPFMFVKGPNNEVLPVSTGYWSRGK